MAYYIKCECCQGRGTTELAGIDHRTLEVLKGVNGGCTAVTLCGHYFNTYKDIVGHSTMLNRLDRLMRYGLVDRRKSGYRNEYIYFAL